MTSQQKSAAIEGLVALILIVIAGALIIDTIGLPPPTREPLGSAALPRAISAIVILFSATVLWRALGRWRSADQEDDRPKAGHRRRTDLAFGTLGLGIFFVALMQSRMIPSVILMPGFLAISMLLLNGFRPRAILPSILVALAVGIGTSLLFTRFFYVDLP